MLKNKGLIKEIIFYTTIAITTLLNYFDLHFINKTVGQYFLVFGAIVSYVYFKHVNALEKSKKKKQLQMIMPIMLIVSRNIFVLFGVFSMCFSVFSAYERTAYNKMMKSVYAFGVVISFLVVVNCLVLYDVYFQKDDRYEGYEYSPTETMLITKMYVGNEIRAAGFAYNLEKTYFNIFRKFDHEVALIPGWARHDVSWISEDEILINGKAYGIYGESIRIVEITNN